MDPVSQDNLMSTLKMNFITNMRTGNAILDAILSIVLVFIAQRMLNKFIYIKWDCSSLFDFLKKSKSEYMIRGVVTISPDSWYTQEMSLPDHYKAVMYKLAISDIDIKCGKQIQSKYRYEKKQFADIASFFINSNEIIKINDDINVKQDTINEKTEKSTIEYYNLTLISHTLTFNQLKKQVEQWSKEYDNYLKEFNDGNMYYFSYNEHKSDDKEDKSKYDEHTFVSNKTFDNVFFDDKKLLMNRLDYFLNNSDEYKRLGIPYTFGLLFHGEPGCGKTSTIKAIANYTKRHVIEISLSKIKKCSELKNIFLNEMINEKYIPNNKKIIVFEDIDCMGDLLNRDNKVTSHIPSPPPNPYSKFSKKYSMFDKDDEHKYKNSKYCDTDDLTLSYVLNLIDGILEQHSRILIISTNYPEKLDKALLRPGRVDTKIHFRKCSQKVCKELIDMYFKCNVDPSLLPDSKYTPAELFEICFSVGSLDKILEMMKK